MVDDVIIELLDSLLVQLTVVWVSEIVAGVALTMASLSATVTPDPQCHIVLTLTQLIPACRETGEGGRGEWYMVINIHRVVR